MSFVIRSIQVPREVKKAVESIFLDWIWIESIHGLDIFHLVNSLVEIFGDQIFISRELFPPAYFFVRFFPQVNSRMNSFRVQNLHNCEK